MTRISRIKSAGAARRAAAAFAALALLLVPFSGAFSAGDTDVIVITKKPAPAQQATYIPGQSEMEFGALMQKLSADVSYTIEEIGRDSVEIAGEPSYASTAKVYIKDSESVRLEFSDAGGNPAVSVYSAGNLWVYFPKTNMIMDMPKEKSALTQGPQNFIDRFLASPRDFMIGKTKSSDATDYEVLDRSGAKVADYRVRDKDTLERIAIYDRDRGTREVKVSGLKYEKIDPALFERPQNAVKMNLGNTTEPEK